MSVPENLLHFSETKENIPRHNHSNFLYLFKTKLDNEDGKSFVKIGLTEKQTLLGRLDDYKPYSNTALTVYPIQINYIHTQDVRLRETLIKRVLNKHTEIEVYHNAEYFKGPYDLLLKIFRFIGLSNIEELKQYSNREKTYNLLNKILELEVPLVEKDYNPRSLNCSKCGKECKDRRGLTLHESKCEKVNTLICSPCGTEFKTNSSLVRHEETCKVIKESLERKKQEEKDERHKNELRNLKETYETQLIALKESYELQLKKMIPLQDKKSEEATSIIDTDTDPYDISTKFIIKDLRSELYWTTRKLEREVLSNEKLSKENKYLNERNDELHEMNRLLMTEIIDDKNRMIRYIEDRDGI